MEWISVKDRLPEERIFPMMDYKESEYVIVAVNNTRTGEVYVTHDFTRSGRWHTYKDKCGYHVTHWMPFPKPPTREE